MANASGKASTDAPAKIWCLFNVANNYDQPDFNLVAWWREKPSLEVLASTLGIDFSKPASDNHVVAVVGVWTGNGSGRLPYSDTVFRLEEVSEGKRLDD
jgi:hypothetical protein